MRKEGTFTNGIIVARTVVMTGRSVTVRGDSRRLVMVVESVWPWLQRRRQSPSLSRRAVSFDPNSETKIPRTNLGVLGVVVCVRGCGEVVSNDFGLK